MLHKVLILTNVGHAPILGFMTEQPYFAEEPEWTLGWRIQRALDHGDLKQKDLMERFELSRDTVSRWCRDIAPAPKKFVLNEIAVMCGVSSRWLIDGESSKPSGGPDRGPDPGTMDYKADVRRLIVGNFQTSSGTAA